MKVVTEPALDTRGVKWSAGSAGYGVHQKKIGLAVTRMRLTAAAQSRGKNSGHPTEILLLQLSQFPLQNKGISFSRTFLLSALFHP